MNESAMPHTDQLDAPLRCSEIGALEMREEALFGARICRRTTVVQLGQRRRVGSRDHRITQDLVR